MRFPNLQHLTSFGRLNGGNYASLPATFSLALIGKSRISGGAWFKCDLNSSAVVTANPHIMGIRCPTGTAAAIQLSLLDSTRVRNGSDEGSVTQNTATTPPVIAMNSWNHLYVATDLAAGTERLWLNGVLVGQVAKTFSPGVFSSGAGAASYLGANSIASAGWRGFLRGFVVSFAPITDSDVWDLYTLGRVPPDSYHWPCDDSRGTALACYKDGNPFPAFDATQVSGANFFSLDVPIPPRIVDPQGNYVWLDGVADCYVISDEAVNPHMRGASILAQSGWAYLDRIQATSVLYVPESASSSALSINILATGLFQFVSRTRNSGFPSVLTPAANHWSNGYPIRQWCHYLHEANFAAKTHTCWLNGRRAGFASAVAWEDTFYTCDPNALGHITVGNGSGFFPGRINSCGIFSPRQSMTDAEAFSLYANGTYPANVRHILNFQVPDLVAPVDTSPQATPITPVSIAAPYGPKHRMYGGIGR